jgi:pyruvate,water dikinase
MGGYEKMTPLPKKPFIVGFKEIDKGARDVLFVGGKGASLADLGNVPGVMVPGGFNVTVESYDRFIEVNNLDSQIKELEDLSEPWIELELEKLKLEEEREGKEKKIGELLERQKKLEETIFVQGEIIRKEMERGKMPPEVEREIKSNYLALCQEIGSKEVPVAVRSSATAEDLPTASFAGQQETFLNVRGEDQVVEAVQKCWISLYGKRAIYYRNAQRANFLKEAGKSSSDDPVFLHSRVHLCAVVMQMVDAKAAGVVFTVHRTTGWPGILIEANWGLGESVVGGKVNPDSWIVDPNTWAIVEKTIGTKDKRVVYNEEGGTEWDETPEQMRNIFSLSDEQVIALARENKSVETDYRRRKPDYKYGDGEFAIDEHDVLFELQHRPETVYSQKDENIIELNKKVVPELVAKEAERAGNLIMRGGVTGSPGAVTGRMNIIPDVSQIDRVQEGDIIVTVRTDPDWVPAMKRANGIITDVGGANCHAAIVSSELGIPCVVGTSIATEVLHNLNGEKITLDADNKAVYKVELPLEEVGENIDVNKLLESPIVTPLGLILSNINVARKMWPLSKLGEKFLISLLRIEFTLMDIGVHVRALADYDNGKLEKRVIEKKNEAENIKSIIRRIQERTRGYPSGKEYFISKLSQALEAFAAVFPRSPIIVRTTDFKTNEYLGLIGGELYELTEANPMLGWRGLIRSLAPENRVVFKWELEAIKRARENGYKNIWVMFPMVRNPLEVNGLREWVAELKKKYRGIPEKDLPRDVKRYLEMWDAGWRDAFEIMKEVGLEPGKDDFHVGIMVEVPTDAIRIQDYIKTGITFISFGTNDLTQFILAVDRDNELLQSIPWYSEADSAVVSSVQKVIEECNSRGIKTGICGRAPTTVPGFAEMLVNSHIDSVGVEISAYMPTWEKIREAEERRGVI